MNLFLFFILSIFLNGCGTIPSSPERDEELGMKCADWSKRSSEELLQMINKKSSQKDLVTKASELIIGCDALLKWVGEPQEPFNGDIKKLSHLMEVEDNDYRKEMNSWKEEVNTYRHAGLNFIQKIITILGAIFLIAVLATTAILILKFKKS